MNLLPSALNESLWAQVIEQLLLVVLVIGRWLLPKGDLSRDELSQLLLVYVGTAADIAELLETFGEPRVNKKLSVTYLILAIWSWSLIQFTIVQASNTKARRRNAPRDSIPDVQEEVHLIVHADETERKTEDFVTFWKWFFTNLDVFGIMLSSSLQDGPFLCIRLYLLIEHNVVSYMMIFFTCKNTLVLLLQWYRLAVLVSERLRQTRNELIAINQLKTQPLLNGSILTGGEYQTPDDTNSSIKENIETNNLGEISGASSSAINISWPQKGTWISV